MRLAGLGDGLSADEGYTWLVSSAPSAGVFFDRLAAYENAPPLYYALAAALPAGDEAWLRLPALIAGVAMIPLAYAVAKPLGGARAGLLAALGMAVAPYAVSASNYARGFTLSDAALLLALAAVVRLATGGSRRWWWGYGAGAAIALWSQYDSALFLVALIGALAWSRKRPLREVVVLGALPALALLPWLPELLRGLDSVGETKVAPVYPGPSPASLRDLLAALAFGEHGSANAAGLRWVQAVAVAAGLLWATLRKGSDPFLRVGVAGTAVGTLGLHALVAGPGPDVFHQRYLTELVPLGVILLAIAVARVPRAAIAGAVALVVLGGAVFVQRHDRELEPDVAAVAAVVEGAAPRTVLTNSAVVVYYLRELRPVLDRPFGLGEGTEPRCAGSCRRSFAVVDDARAAGGARAGPGPRRAFGPIVVRLTRK